MKGMFIDLANSSPSLSSITRCEVESHLFATKIFTTSFGAFYSIQLIYYIVGMEFNSIKSNENVDKLYLPHQYF